MDSSLFKIYLPFPGVPKERARQSRGHFYTPTRTRDYEQHARMLMKSQYIFNPLDKPVEVWVAFIFARPARTKFGAFPAGKPDLDNLEKSLFDAANKVLWTDDCRVVKKHSQKVWAQDGQAPGVLLEFREIH